MGGEGISGDTEGRHTKHWGYGGKERTFYVGPYETLNLILV